MPSGLKRYQQAGDLHFITFSCYRRQPLFSTAKAKRIFEQTLERVRRWYGLFVTGYVVMPEHVHLLLSEPERRNLAVALQMLKQITAQKIEHPAKTPLWQARYYDLNVWTAKKRIEKLRYIHRNPVKRGLVGKPEDWEWSSFRHYATGVEGVVEIESEWTGRRRERMGAPLRVTVAPTLSPKAGEKDGAPPANNSFLSLRKGGPPGHWAGSWQRRSTRFRTLVFPKLSEQTSSPGVNIYRRRKAMVRRQGQAVGVGQAEAPATVEVFGMWGSTRQIQKFSSGCLTIRRSATVQIVSNYCVRSRSALVRRSSGGPRWIK